MAFKILALIRRSLGRIKFKAGGGWPRLTSIVFLNLVVTVTHLAVDDDQRNEDREKRDHAPPVDFLLLVFS